MMYTRSLLAAAIGILFSIFAFATPATATDGTVYGKYSDRSLTYEFTAVVEYDFDFTVPYLYASPNRNWKTRAAEYDRPVFKDLSKRTGQSFRRTRQPHVTGAPFVM